MTIFIVTPRDAVDVNQLRSILNSAGYTDLLDKQQCTFRPHARVVVWEPTVQFYAGGHYATRCTEHVTTDGVYAAYTENVSVNELARHLCQ